MVDAILELFGLVIQLIAIKIFGFSEERAEKLVGYAGYLFAGLFIGILLFITFKYS